MPPPPVQISLRQQKLPEISALEVEWRTLEAVARPSFFTSWHWIGTLLHAVPEDGRPSLLRGVANGKTIALCLLGARLIRRRLGLIRCRTLYINETGDPEHDLTIEHNGLLVATRYEQAVNRALIEWFLENDTDADELQISGSVHRLPALLVEERGLARIEVGKPWFYMELDRLRSSGGDLSCALSRNARQQLRRAIRDYEKSGELTLTRPTDLADAQCFFSDLKELHCATWRNRGKRHAFDRAFFEPFHRSLIERNLSEGTVELVRAAAGPRTIGYLYNFRLGEVVYAYQSGFSYEERESRPGAVAHALAIRDAYRSGAGTYDFLAGRNRLKESFSTHSRLMYWQLIQRPRFDLQIENSARRLKRLLRGPSINHHAAMAFSA
jgi:CelD/BcsL family acetyltransferase involved in cellulose biosynthesis